MNWPVFIGTLVVAALAAWWTFKDARSRDSSPLLWAAGIVISALMLGPVGGPVGSAVVLGVYLLARPRGALLVCPHCKRRYIHNLAFCPHCGKPVKKECLRCHDTMELDAETCPHCGMKAL
ncbi:MAG: zinc ribbon domain-containing protein [Bacillota bacterium]